MSQAERDRFIDDYAIEKLRDTFAAAALTGLLDTTLGDEWGAKTPKNIAKAAFIIADEMLLARKKNS